MAYRKNLQNLEGVINFLTSNFDLYGIPEKNRPTKEEHLSRRNINNSVKKPETLKYTIVHPECTPETE